MKGEDVFVSQLRAAVVQMTSSDVMVDNQSQIQEQVERAASQGAALVALPENAYFMRRETKPGEPTLPLPDYGTADHPGIGHASQLAKKCHLWLLVGSVAVRNPASHKFSNRSLLFGPSGELQAHYDKIHLFDVTLPDGQSYQESASICPGHQLVSHRAAGCLLGLSICYDLRFPLLYRRLAQAGAEVLTVPAAFTVPTGRAHWEVLLRARAIETGSFVLAPAQSGSHPGGRQTYGHSLIINPWGEVLACLSHDGPGVAVVDLDLEEVVRARGCIPSLQLEQLF